MQTKPFRMAGFTMVPNAAIDHVFPRLSYPARAVLLVVLRQTLGWEGTRDNIDPETGRKMRDWLPVRQIMRMAGIGGVDTTHRAIIELLDTQLINRIQTGMYRGKPQFEYSLNKDFSLTVPSKGTVAPLTVPLEGTPTVPLEGTVTLPTVPLEGTSKESINKQKNVVIVSLIEKLTALNVTAKMINQVIETYPPDYIQEKINYTLHKAAAMSGDGFNPAGFLITALREDYSAPAGFDPAQCETDQERKNRYLGIGTDLEYIIQH